MAEKPRSKAPKGHKTAESEGMPVATPSATVRALSIPELLFVIFAFSEKPELARSARVCKDWSDAALDELWKDLDSIFPLLELVLDLDLLRTASHNSATPEAYEDISSALANADWSRFYSHAKRVQSLEYVEGHDYRELEDMPALGSSVIGVICLHYPYGPCLLPHLRKALWYSGSGSALSILPFLPKDLAHLDLELFGSSDGQLKAAFNAFRNRSLHLKSFTFSTEVAGPISDAALGLWLETMETLESVKLPDYYLTTPVLSRIGTLPRLRVIDLFKASFDDDQVESTDARMVGELPSGSFPSLVELSLPATPATAQRLLFNSRTDFAGLTRLDLNAEKDIE
ncbi:hypothetical protein FRC01_004337, partial [Tulasnella sp. 417]